MAKPDLHKFRDDLRNNPPKGSNAPPRTIRAKNLDENFVKVTVIESDETDPVPYVCEYTKDGTRLKNMRPLPSRARTKKFLICESGQPREYWMIVWDNEPTLPPEA